MSTPRFRVPRQVLEYALITVVPTGFVWLYCSRTSPMTDEEREDMLAKKYNRTARQAKERNADLDRIAKAARDQNPDLKWMLGELGGRSAGGSNGSGEESSLSRGMLKLGQEAERAEDAGKAK